jgi:phosphoglycolate phosphatase-like HAD superfamily hydrolase
MGIIFDLDQTLVDTKFIEPYRDKGDWGAVRRLVPKVEAYPGIDAIMQAIAKQGIPIAIVTKSPSFYLDLILDNLGWNVQYKVCYHDVPRGYHKPHPMSIQKAVDGLGISSTTTHSFGDRDIDIIASKGVPVKSIGCLWGCDDPMAIQKSDPDIILNTPEDLRAYLVKEFSLIV